MSLMRPKTKAKPVAPPSPTAPGVIFGAFIRNNGRAITIALGWMLAVCGVVFGLRALEPQARAAVRGETRIEWVGLPGWLNDPYWQSIKQEVADGVPELYPDTQIYDANVCKWVSDHVANSPWIAKLHKVTKTNDGRVLIYADFRKPFSLIERNGRAYLIDRAGVVLPRSETNVDYGQWITIRGVKAPPPAVGQVWPGQDVQDALKLVDYLGKAEADGKLPVRRFLRSVDASEHNPKTTQLRVLTVKPESYIYWGCPPGEEYTVEASAARKLAALCEESKIQKWVANGESIDIRAGEWVDRFIGRSGQ